MVGSIDVQERIIVIRWRDTFYGATEGNSVCRLLIYILYSNIVRSEHILTDSTRLIE